jgi:DNA repair protein RadC
MNAQKQVEYHGVVGITDAAAPTAPWLHELTMQHRPKRDADGRAIRLGPAVTNAYQAARFLGQILAFEDTEVFGVLCLTTPRRVIGWHEVSRGTIDGVCVHRAMYFARRCSATRPR